MNAAIVIDRFAEDNFFLSNFYPCQIVGRDYTYTCAEAAYQAAKCMVLADRSKFVGLNGAKSKYLGRKIKVRRDWAAIKLDVMRRLLEIKFSDPKLAAMLVATGDAALVEGNYWGDVYWGVCRGKGQNHMGHLLMKLRQELVGELNLNVNEPELICKPKSQLDTWMENHEEIQAQRCK
jgi:hypothetical protein